MAPTVPESAVSFGVRDTAQLLVLPYAQSFAWVEPSRLFSGTHPRDDRLDHWGSVLRLRASVEVPLRALSWYFAPDSVARYHLAVLFAERTVLVPVGRAAGVPPAGGRRATGQTVVSSRIYRGIAIRRVIDGATFWYVLPGGDRWTAEALIGNLVGELAVGRLAPSPPES
jgi:hypothetical protein